MGKVSFYVDWGDGRVYYGKMGVWLELGRGQGGLRVLIPEPKVHIDFIYTCRVQRALICGLE